MEPVTQVSGDAYPWGAKNVDTDVIIPAHWLKTITRAGLGKGAFETVRAEPGNIFDDPRHAGSPILIAEIGRAHVRTPVTNAHLVCRLLLEKKKYNNTISTKPPLHHKITKNSVVKH